MISYQTLFERLHAVENPAIDQWLARLPDQIAEKMDCQKHGDLLRWLTTLDQIKALKLNPSNIDFNASRITVGDAYDHAEQREKLLSLLQALHPWRKGPFEVFGIHIDTEWRSDWKWDRLKQYIQPLKNRRVLDVGCGNGYHCWRMLGEHAEQVIGIDPNLLSIVQFNVIKQLAGVSLPIDILPLTLEQMPKNLPLFDTVFSMGVLYHRRSPIDHLYELSACLAPGGQLVLETLVIEGAEGQVLLPENRYAQMRNVWFLPSCDTLHAWMKRCGYEHIKQVDVDITSTEEQRSTEWMKFHSLKNFLDPADQTKTIEGYPAPRRAIFTCKKAY